MPATLWGNGAETYSLSSNGLPLRATSQRLQALMLGLASALNNVLRQSRALGIQIAAKTFHFPIANACVHIAKRHDDRHRRLSWDEVQCFGK
jgi:hypothetical protein